MSRPYNRQLLPICIAIVAACAKNDSVENQAEAQPVADMPAFAEADSSHRAPPTEFTLVPPPRILALIGKHQGRMKLTSTQLHDAAMVELIHDGEKMQIKKGSDDLGPMLKLWAHVPKWDDSELTSWRPVAYMEVNPFDAGAPSNNAYTDLGIRYDNTNTNTYCVHLKRVSADDYTAALTLVANDECGDPDQATALAVGLEDNSTYTQADSFPNVVRLNDDIDDGPTIGVNCGLTRWCEIGRSKSKGAKPYHFKVVTPKNAQEFIKAWHDEKKITLLDATAGKLKRGIRASIVPVPNIASFKAADYSSGQLVARIYLDQKPPKKSKYGEDTGWGLKKGENEVRLFAKESPAGSGKYKWWATFNPVTEAGNGRRFKADWKPHAQPPGVARWRWDSNDEDIWVPCDQGCCIVSSGFQIFAASDTAK